jgi:hypothetical protein
VIYQPLNDPAPTVGSGAPGMQSGWHLGDFCDEPADGGFQRQAALRRPQRPCDRRQLGAEGRELRVRTLRSGVMSAVGPLKMVRA